MNGVAAWLDKLLSQQNGEDPTVMVLAAFFAIGGIIATFIVGYVKTDKDKAAIETTAEYRCLAAARGKPAHIHWDSVRNPRFPKLGPSIGIGTLKQKRGMNCIPDGDAVSFVVLPEQAVGSQLSILRIPGPEAKYVYRDDGNWVDFTDVTGMHRWHNDGSDYRKVAP